MSKKVFTKDRVKIGQRSVLVDGSILAPITLARTGILEYYGYEIGRYGEDEINKVFKVYRPESTLFAQETIDSFKYCPFTLEHPAEMIDFKSDDSLKKGYTGPNLVKSEQHVDGEYGLDGEVLITAKDAISALNELEEVSIGFYTSYDHTPGITPNGEHYDSVQTEMEGNHVALVTAGRCGNSCRVFDDNPTKIGDSTMSKKVVKIGNTDCAIDESVAQTVELAVSGLNQANADLQSANDKLATEKSAADAAKDAAETELNEYKTKFNQEAIDAAVEHRLDLIARAKKLNPEMDFKGKDSKTIMVEALSNVAKDSDLSDKDDSYVAAYFDIAVSKSENNVDHNLLESMRRSADNDGNKDSSLAKANKEFIENCDENFIGNKLEQAGVV